MLNEKIDKLIHELDTAAGMLIVTAMKDQTVRQAMEKVSNVSFELCNLIDEIETEKAIDGCRLRILEMEENGAGDCGIDENGNCKGYSYDGDICEECRTCAYCAYEEEEI